MRRLGTCAAFAVTLVALSLPAAARGEGFNSGVTAGEVTSDSAIIWGRADRKGPVNARVAKDRKMTNYVDRQGLEATGDNDRTIQTHVSGLDAGESYYYRFCDPDDGVGVADVGAAVRRNRCSDKGRFVTAPKPGKDERIEFAYTGDYDAEPEPGEDEPFWNDFEIFREIKREENDFNIALGDTIYSDSEVPGIDEAATSVEEKWQKYRQNLDQRNLQRARKSAGFYSHWDDHEFLNDFYPGKKDFEYNGNPINIPADKVYERGVRAFEDYSPVNFTEDKGLYRSIQWGENLELFWLDQRSFRDKNADEGGTCDNPQSGEPDFAPTAPQETRNLFSPAVPSLGEEVAKKCKRRIKDSDRSFLGSDQLERFKRQVKNSDATFKVIVNETPIQQFYVLPYDRWEGFEAERRHVLRFLRDKVDNAIFLTEDWHATLVNDARLKTLEDNGPKDSGILEVVASPVATANVNIEFERETGVPNLGTLADALFFEPPPPAGVGMQCSVVDEFAYGHVTVTDDQLTVRPRDIEGNPLLDAGIPCGPFTIDKE